MFREIHWFNVYVVMYTEYIYIFVISIIKMLSLIFLYLIKLKCYIHSYMLYLHIQWYVPNRPIPLWLHRLSGNWRSPLHMTCYILRFLQDINYLFLFLYTYTYITYMYMYIIYIHTLAYCGLPYKLKNVQTFQIKI